MPVELAVAGAATPALDGATPTTTGMKTGGFYDTQFLGGSAPSVNGSFAIAPAEVAPFTTSTELDKTRFDVAASVDVFTRKDLVVRAELFGSFSDNSESYGGGLQVELPF